ncbi:MAG TPA: IclR family transcriptional regulator [Nocardioidaceae bacterium]|nr:IclR family transcriptional regulator [Nocardioidaceae bacterium]
MLGKVRTILDAFTQERPRLRLAEIRQATGIPSSTCLRLVQNLVQEGFLARVGDEYRIGTGMLRWLPVALAAIDVVALAQPILDRLREQTQELACLFVAEGDARVCIALAQSRQGTVRRLSIGESLPLHAGSAGKILLAYDEALFARVVRGDLQRYTENTVTDPEPLRAEVGAARRDGWAMSLNESYSGAGSLSVPSFDFDGRIAAVVCLAAPAERFGEAVAREWLPYVEQAAGELTRIIGGRAPRRPPEAEL